MASIYVENRLETVSCFAKALHQNPIEVKTRYGCSLCHGRGSRHQRFLFHNGKHLFEVRFREVALGGLFGAVSTRRSVARLDTLIPLQYGSNWTCVSNSQNSGLLVWICSVSRKRTV